METGIISLAVGPLYLKVPERAKAAVTELEPTVSYMGLVYTLVKSFQKEVTVRYKPVSTCRWTSAARETETRVTS